MQIHLNEAFDDDLPQSPQTSIIACQRELWSVQLVPEAFCAPYHPTRPLCPDRAPLNWPSHRRHGLVHLVSKSSTTNEAEMSTTRWCSLIRQRQEVDAEPESSEFGPALFFYCYSKFETKMCCGWIVAICSVPAGWAWFHWWVVESERCQCIVCH